MKTISDARELVYRDPRILRPYERNAKQHPPEQLERIKASIRKRGFTAPLLLRDDEISIGVGHGRWAAVLEMLDAGERLPTPDGETIPTIVLYGLSDADWQAYIIDDNKVAEGGTWNHEFLRFEFAELQSLGYDLNLTGFSAPELGELNVPGFVSDPGPPPESKVSLADRFGIPPFSVLNAREGWWQDRKRAWLALGIKSEVGRGDADEADAKTNAGVLMPSHTAGDPQFYAKKRAAELALGRKLTTDVFLRDHYQASDAAVASGTSIFDPVLCELLIRWFSPPGGVVLDPFAGGSVRGVVAGRLGRRYVGTDLRAEQVEANRIQADAIFGAAPPKGQIAPEWVVSDGRRVETVLEGDADFVFSCPPYADLERYSDDPRDLSTMSYPEFIDAYREIIAAAGRKLKKDGFAAFVVGDVRDEKGHYRGFVRDTELAFEAAGLRLYNEAILLTAIASTSMRAGRGFEATRVLGKAHQNVLIFVKGDRRKATKACGKVEFGEIDATAGHDDAPPE